MDWRSKSNGFLALPGNTMVSATSPSGAVVNYTATATDAVDGPITPSCSPASGNTKSCTAIDNGILDRLYGE